MTDREIFETEITKQGLKTGNDPDAKRIIESSFAHIADILSDALEGCPIGGLFVYRKGDQDADSPFRAADGVAFLHRARDGRKAFSLAIASETILQGQGYMEFVLLHELSHALVEPVQDHGQTLPHDAVFEAALDQLIMAYETRTGEDVEENDYSGYFHGDQNGYNPPASPRIALCDLRTD